MKSREKVMNMLEAFDLTGSFRDAGELAGCSHHTVAAYVAKRDAGELAGDGPRRRERIIDPWLAKIEEWVERSHGKIRADVAFEKLCALGFEGSERTVRRAAGRYRSPPSFVAPRGCRTMGSTAGNLNSGNDHASIEPRRSGQRPAGHAIPWIGSSAWRIRADW